MEGEFVIATRLPIPGKLSQWTFEINDMEKKDELVVSANLESDQKFIEEIQNGLPTFIVLPIIDDSKLVLKYESLVRVKPVGAMSCIFAYSLCRALGGIVIEISETEPTHRIIFESAPPLADPANIEELESLIWNDFKNPVEILKQWVKETDLLQLE